MGFRALQLSSSPSGFTSNVGILQNLPKLQAYWNFQAESFGQKGRTKQSKQSLFSGVTEALDFYQVRSEEDAQLLEDAREATKSVEEMTREQYGALRRKIRGTYKDFFKSYVDDNYFKPLEALDVQYVEEGSVDKSCKVSARKTRGVNQDKLTSLEDMSMLLAWRNQMLETFLPDCSQDEVWMGLLTNVLFRF